MKNIEIKDYSPKAIAVIGDTSEIKGMLKDAGGKYNRYLSCGAGWIFSKKRLTEVKRIIEISERKYRDKVINDDVESDFTKWFEDKHYDRIIKMIESCLGIESKVTEVDILGNEIRSSNFYGYGCGISFLTIDGRKRKANEIYKKIQGIPRGDYFVNKIAEHFGRKMCERYEIVALYYQDYSIGCYINDAVCRYLVEKCGLDRKYIQVKNYYD